MAERRYELILAGGGLAAGLTAWRVKTLRPQARVAVVEREARLGGRHTWSFFDSDLDPELLAWIRPAVARRWDGYEVRFPERRRTLATPYNSLTSESLHAAVAPVLGEDLFAGAEIVEVSPRSVTLADGRTFEAEAVIDCRGPRAAPALDLAWQKFVGLELRTAEPHGLTRPIVMDATVEQFDGYRFVYVLPFAPDRLLVEDTYYADGAALPVEVLTARVLAYAEASGWRVAEVLQTEEGVLPIALGGDVEAFWRAGDAATARAGLAAALFHPTTGYGLPDAVATADAVTRRLPADGETLRAFTEARAVRLWRERGFFRLLNRMLFRACPPGERWRVLQRFYGLPEPLIRRFYAARMRLGDKARVLAGKPPVPVGAALRQLGERRLRAH